MTLSTIQKEFIAHILEDFIELSDEPNTLRKEISQLKQALVDQVDSENPFTVISECFKHPCDRFQGLEKQQINMPITVGMVQAYIIELLTEHIQKAADKAGLSLSKLDWDSTKLAKKFISAENESVPFVSVRIMEIPQADWDPIHEEGAIYQYIQSIDSLPGNIDPFNAGWDDINQSAPSYVANLTITTQLSDDASTTCTISVQETVLGEADDADMQALESLRESCRLKAKEKAAGEAMNFLLHNKLIDLDFLVENDLIGIESDAGADPSSDSDPDSSSESELGAGSSLDTNSTKIEYYFTQQECSLITNSYYFNLIEAETIRHT